MSDPLRKVKIGDPPGRVFEAATFNCLLDAAKFYRGRMPTKVGSPGAETDPLVPSCKVYVRNMTGGTLLPWSCVTPTGDAPIDPETLPVNANDQPVFEVQAPAATTDPVLITMEPIADGAIGEAAALGVCVAQVNVTDGAHRFAVPVVGSTASLASAASGPARILAPWNTGNSTRLVMLCGQAGVGVTVEEADGSPSYTSISTIRFDQSDGFTITQPAAGIARVDFTGSGSTITVKEQDGTPTYTSIATVQVNQTDGFVLTNPSLGNALISMASASASQKGAVDTTTQTFAGNKTLNGSFTIPSGGGYTVSINGTPTAAFSLTPTVSIGQSGALCADGGVECRGLVIRQANYVAGTNNSYQASFPGIGASVVFDFYWLDTGGTTRRFFGQFVNHAGSMDMDFQGPNWSGWLGVPTGYSVAGTHGASGSFTAGTKTVTVVGGIITSIV